MVRDDGKMASPNLRLNRHQQRNKTIRNTGRFQPRRELLVSHMDDGKRLACSTASEVGDFFAGQRLSAREGKWNFNTARDYGKFGVRYEQNQVPVLIPTLNGYGNPDDWGPLADGGKAWPMKGGVFVMLDRIYLKAYEISGTDFVLTLSDYDAVDKVFKIRIPAAFLSSFLASIPNDRRLIPQSLSNSPSTFGVQYAVLNESAKAEMKIPGDAMRVMGIVPGKIADRAGLKNFDVLLRFGDQPLKQTQDLSDAVHAVSKGATVPLTVWRDAKEVRLQAQF